APGAPAPAPAPAPTRDDLVQAWGDEVLDALRSRARALYRAGRFVAAGDGTAVFALPGESHRHACEPCRAEVEAALSAHFGTPLRLRLVVDEEPGRLAAEDPPGRGGPQPGRSGAQPGDEVIDLTEVEELAEAEAGAASVEQRLLQAFPGAEEIGQPAPAREAAQPAPAREAAPPARPREAGPAREAGR
ncbi:MAG: hypothetical protein ACRD0L_12540, partial [Acidimicrobiales bacterium]